MQYTPESNISLESCKGQHCYEDISDSGYSGLFHSPQSISRVDSCSSLSSVEFSETPKENLRISVTPKGRMNKSDFLDNDSRGAQQSSAVSWCETPKIHKKVSSFRHRLLMCKPTTAIKNDNPRSPCNRRLESSTSTRPEHKLSASFDSLDTVMGCLASSTLKLEQDLPLSGRKRRILFSQVRTSTLEDGKLNSRHPFSFEGNISLSDADFSESISRADESNIETPRICKFLPASSKDDSQSPISEVTNRLHASTSLLCTPSCTHTPRHIRYVLCH